MKTRVIFASLILGLGITASASAATTIFDDSPAASKAAGTLLVNGSEKSFASFIEQKAYRITRQPEWQTYMNVVSMYNQNPVSVLSLSAAERDNFLKASSKVTGQLAKLTDATATQWLAQANNTVRILTYFWTVSADQPQLPDNE
ncbi:hypothetical protein ACAW74_10075 [Fibrella sp. WM1]|uniref:hypothetical protein n=1 Tax=Fibrella musci TaxID=3242485 RepID=UPI003522AE82